MRKVFFQKARMRGWLMAIFLSISSLCWAAQSDVIKSVTVNGNKFTVERADASAATVVNYRTMDGSAIGGIHFEHQSGRLYFDKGVTTQSVEVKTIDNPSGIDAFSNVDRKYGFVAWNDFSENHYAEAVYKTKKGFSYNSNWRSKLMSNQFAWNDKSVKQYFVYFWDIFTPAEQEYMIAQPEGWKIDTWFSFNTYRLYHGYYMIKAHIINDAWVIDNRYDDWGSSETWYTRSFGVWERQVLDPRKGGDLLYTWWDAEGDSDDEIIVSNLTGYFRVYDTDAPKLLGVSCNSERGYTRGDILTIALKFNEIVNISSSSKIETNVGTFDYAGGDGSNILYFKGVLNEKIDANELKVNSINNSVSDVAGNRCNLNSIEDNIKDSNFKYKYSNAMNLSCTPNPWKKAFKLTWDEDVLNNASGSYNVYRYVTEDGIGTQADCKLVIQGAKSGDFDSDESLLYDVNYTYWVEFIPSNWTDDNKLIGRHAVSQSKENVLTRDFSITANISPNDDYIQIDWDITPFMDKESHSFQIYRGTDEKDSANFSSILTSPISVTDNSVTHYSYQDKSIESGCATYFYYVKTSYLFSDDLTKGRQFCSNMVSGNLTSSSQVTSVEASKGMYQGVVKLSWSAIQVGTQSTNYNVYRRELGTSGDWVKIYNVSGTETSYAYDDNSALPGKYYEYKVSSSYYCPEDSAETQPLSKYAEGFCRATGVLSGRVTYGTGTAVEGVKVVAIKNVDEGGKDQFYALRADGNGIQLPLTEEKGKSYFEGKPWTIQMYVRPEDSIKGRNGDVVEKSVLIDSKNNFGLYLTPASKTKYTVGVMYATGDSMKYVETSVKIPVNKYSHLTFSYDGNGNFQVRSTDAVEKITKSSVKAESITYKADSCLLFGAASNDKDIFRGYLDEVRIFSGKELTDAEIKKNFNHTLSGNEENLVLYWPMDEGINNQSTLYDYSKTAGACNNNHGTIVKGDFVSSNNIPTENQLSIFGYTDNKGNYTINGIPFSGEGTTYMITPSYGVHKFTPEDATRFISPTSLVYSGVNFEDVSSFPVKGSVTYYNTSYPVEGANIYVDGTICSKDGELITTDANGEFIISVPIGDHHIQVKKQENGLTHVFANNGRFPSNSLKEYTFESELSGLTFYDSTFVTLTGRVAGGVPESKKPHGLGTGQATIGKATITLTAGDNVQFNLDKTKIRTFGNPSEYVNSTVTTGKYDDGEKAKVITIHTDSATGEFAVSLPPVDFKVKSVKVDNNPTIQFSTENIESILLGTGSLHTTTDSLAIAEGDTATFEYLYALDLIHRSNPVLEFTSNNNNINAFGDEKYVYKDDATLALDTIPLYSVDSIGNVSYTFGYPLFTQGCKYKHQIYLYEPYYNYDSTTVRKTEIPLTNADIKISNNLGAIAVAIENGTDENGNDVKDGDVVESGNMALLTDSLGKVDYSFQATYPNIVEPYTLGMNINFVYNDESYEWSENGKFAGIVTGGLQTGSNFITAGPDKVLFVLRDPPGSGSSAYLEKGQTITTSSKVTTEYNSEYSLKSVLKFGLETRTAVGIGVAIISDAESKFDVNVGTEISYDATHEQSNTYKITATEKISTSSESDYVGEDGDLFIGSSTNIIMGKTRKVAPVKDVDGNYSIDMFEAVSLGDELTTQFKYTQNYIENVLIPNLTTVRNSFLRKVSATEYSMDYPNNTDETIYITKLNEDNEQYGTKGTYYCIPSIKNKDNHTDTVGYFNSQINTWKMQLAYNEIAKVYAIESHSDYNEEEYNKAVRKIEEAKSLENTLYLLFNPDKPEYVKLDSTFWFKYQDGVKYSEYGDNKIMIDAIFDKLLISREEYEKYLLAKPNEMGITLFYNNGWKVKNVSFDAGTEVEESIERCGSTSTTDATSTKGLAVVGLATGFTFSGFGFSIEAETKQGGTEGFEESSETENCTSIGYTLADDGVNDALSVDVFQAPDGFGPIFYTRAGQTSCPYEDEKKTKYYEKDKHTLATKTMQIEYPRITVAENNLKAQKQINIPSGSAANFTLNLDNLSETSENIWYTMRVLDETNPNGAALSIDGVPFATARQILVNAMETTHKNLQIKQSRMDIMKYDSIAVVLSSNCQEDIADTIYLSVEFIPSCSPLTLQIDDRTMNIETHDTLQLVIKDFEKDYLNFTEIRLQYKGERDNNWNLAKKFMVEDLDGARQVISYPMSSNLFNDQTYQFRAISVCAKGASDIITNESETIELIKDMARPQVLGNPNPSDGILEAGDEISVTYNEDIRNSLLSKNDNFIIEAVLNDAEVDHNVALKMDSTSKFAAATEAKIGLAKKSFTIDMWVNLSSGGTLLKHNSKDENFTVSVGSTGKLTVNVNGTKATSSETIPFNKWCFLTLSYDVKSDSAASISALVAYDAEDVKLLADKKLPVYGATGTLSLGKNIRGAISEVALWGTKRTNDESQSQMHFAKSASTENLIGYWKFNEGHGTVAKDAARSRNMALAADSWYLNNKNIAAKLTGENHLSLDITRSTALSSDDYMMEMWFRGKSQKNATLWSANTKVALKFNANGYLTLLTDSVENQLSTANYLDGAWHHVAMNVLRNGTTTIYVDGAIVKQLSSTKVPALQASELTIGAQRYSPSYAVFDYKDYFKGDVDEVRYWLATFNAKAIDQNRYIRLKGDEAGLEAYYPFERDTLDAGITIYEFSLKDMSLNAVGKAKGSVTEAATAPALQPKPNMTKVNYSFVASERTVAITLNENPSRLEGTTVNFTVKNVRDENNNFSLPVTWSAYVNQNRLIWGDDAISLEKNTEDEASFNVSVVNQGATTESWSISNLPSWLTASKNSGSLSALKSETIEFQISNAVPTGSYEETIYLVGNEGINVPFTLNLKVNAGKPNWNVDPSQFENSMSVIAQLKLDDNYSTDTEDLVAAFINGTCVGVASPKYYSRYDAYFVSLDIYGNSTDANKKVVFKAWDASTGVTYPTLSTSSNIKFSSNKLYGSMAEPIILSSNKLQEQNLDLKKGWNWISLNVKPSNDSINAVFGDIANKTNVLKSKTNFSQSNGDEFSGALKTVKIGSMYKVQMNTATDYQVAGDAIDASKETVTIKSGWNWIGFNSTAIMSLNEAFADLNPVDGDMVKGQSGFAYYEGYEWVGTLNALTPGKGYMFKSVASEKRTFKYPAKSSSLRSLISKNTTTETVYKTVNETAYSGNMTIVAVVKDGHDVLNDVQIGIFDAKGKCRAAAATDENSLAFLTVMGGESADALTIKVIYNGFEYVLDQDLVYADDATLGTLSNPYIIQLNPVDANSDVLNGSISVYPTLVETSLNVKAESLNVTSYSISDISGRIMMGGEVSSSEFTINVSALTQGAYILVMETENGTVIKRFTKK
ncbi:MAG: T9SS type A sorting domain-containing protein [Paludibacteraceae bacterium]|nr:T9SS type A sorting domain-containing protein [Paludibacteraceae bacterium]